MGKLQLFDTIIIGAGIIGMLTAELLSKRGHSICLLDKGIAGAESSWAGGGILSPLYAWRFPDAVNDLAHWSQLHYPDYLADLQNRTGIDAQWLQSGLLIHGIQSERSAIETWLKHYPQAASFLSSEQAHTIEPNSVHCESLDAESLWLPDIAQLRNPRFIKMMCKALDITSVTLRENSEVTEILIKNNQFHGVKLGTEKLNGRHLIIAGGAWTAELESRIACTVETTIKNPKIDVYPVRGQMMIFKTPRNTLSRILLSAEHYLIPRKDGRVLIGSTVEQVGFNKTTTQAGYHELYQAAIQLAPVLADFPVEFHWSGLRPGSKSGIPYICQHPRVEGVYLNSGHYRNGIILAYSSAQLMTDIIENNPPIFDISPFQV